MKDRPKHEYPDFSHLDFTPRNTGWPQQPAELFTPKEVGLLLGWRNALLKKPHGFSHDFPDGLPNDQRRQPNAAYYQTLLKGEEKSETNGPNPAPQSFNCYLDFSLLNARMIDV